MTTEQRKEETRKKFNEAYNAEIVRLAEFDLGTDSLMNFIFDFFYSEIEARDNQIKILAEVINEYDNIIDGKDREIQNLQELLDQY